MNANTLPGDMMWKNFCLTRQGKVVFYNYDHGEIEHLSDCNFRRVPPRQEDDKERADGVWSDIGQKDAFPETQRQPTGQVTASHGGCRGTARRL